MEMAAIGDITWHTSAANATMGARRIRGTYRMAFIVYG
jgi:hypothetical protein